MGEWNENDGAGGLRALLGRVSDRQREAMEAWKRGEPGPDDVPQMTETTGPKRVYTGNRKARRAMAAR